MRVIGLSPVRLKPLASAPAARRGIRNPWIHKALGSIRRPGGGSPHGGDPGLAGEPPLHFAGGRLDF